MASPNIQTILPPIKLFEQYIAKQELTPEDLQAHQIRLVATSEILNVPEFVLPAVLLPYFKANGELSGALRYRKLAPRPGDGRYWQLKGSNNFGAYLPQGLHDWESVFANPKDTLVVCEGEIKSIIAQKYITDIPILSIGGVGMWNRILDEYGIVWRGRTVVIAFDHDEGQEPGEYKPQVALMMARFAEALTLRGAKVLCTQLGICARDQGIDGKVGLDDYFRLGGDPAALIDRLTTPPAGCELLADMYDKYVIVGLAKPVVWDSCTGVSYAFGAFRDLNQNKFKMEQYDANRAPKKVRVAEQFLERPDRPEATKFVMDPRLPVGYLADQKLINTWVPFVEHDRALAREEYVKAFGRLVDVLAGEFPKQVGQWLAHYVRRPWERTSQAVLISTPHMGIGKSLLGEMIGYLVGSAHWAEVDEERLTRQFNDHLQGKTWMLWNEMDLRFAKSESWFRNLLTQEVVTVEIKNGAVYDVVNCRRYMLNSNMAVAARLSEGNRRVWVCYPELVDDELDDWKAWLGREVLGPWHEDREAWLASMLVWVESVDLEGYRPMAEVVNGVAARELIEGSMSKSQSAAAILMEGWIDSGDELLVIGPEFIHRYKEVVTVFNSLVKRRGWMSGRKVMRDGGPSRSYRVYQNSDDGESFKNDKGTVTYVGTGKDLNALKVSQNALLIAATEHLDD